MNKIEFPIGYSIAEDGTIIGLTEENFKKSKEQQWNEVCRYVISQYLESYPSGLKPSKPSMVLGDFSLRICLWSIGMYIIISANENYIITLIGAISLGLLLLPDSVLDKVRKVWNIKLW